MNWRSPSAQRIAQSPELTRAPPGRPIRTPSLEEHLRLTNSLSDGVTESFDKNTESLTSNKPLLIHDHRAEGNVLTLEELCHQRSS